MLLSDKFYEVELINGFLRLITWLSLISYLTLVIDVAWICTCTCLSILFCLLVILTPFHNLTHEFFVLSLRYLSVLAYEHWQRSLNKTHPSCHYRPWGRLCKGYIWIPVRSFLILWIIFQEYVIWLSLCRVFVEHACISISFYIIHISLNLSVICEFVIGGCKVKVQDFLIGLAFDLAVIYHKLRTGLFLLEPKTHSMQWIYPWTY